MTSREGETTRGETKRGETSWGRNDWGRKRFGGETTRIITHCLGNGIPCSFFV